MPLLPLFKGGSPDLELLTSKWKSIIDPFLQKPANQSSILKNVVLVNGTTIVNHLLGRPLSGWKVVRQRSQAQIYDLQDINQQPNLTLLLSSNANVVVDLEVF